MPPNIDKIIPGNYQRAFFFKNLGYLFVDSAFAWYKRRDFIAVFQDGMLGQYIGNEAADKCLENGKKIFSSEANFKIFEAGFRKTIKEVEEYISKAKKLDKVTINDFFDLRALSNKGFYYFEKTEFYFTDSCYVGTTSDLLKKNLLTLGDSLKFKARPLMVELLTTIPYKFTEIVAKDHNLNAEELKSYSFDEIRSLMEIGEPLDQKIISERKKSFVVYCENSAIIPIIGGNKEIILDRFKEPDYSKLTEFRGVVANRGKIKAKAKVILPELDQDYNLFVKKLHAMEFNQGEILVTETTSPDFVPLMKKAGGVIANQGGMNSHAAIISRELGIPCLVGTYHATDILATGDLIELDANVGVVKIIKKNI